ncbi:MAG TPA: preprotein translocase subunit SecY [Candidatus Hydrogenedentes bacterium]|nr:MAG: preprotein translocase subunit SecY [Candidatus Hydrogenedentes bacterium ADurb.Bin170]HOD95641.1 preprotein translocase subunit SecY [Candidatus Hydrogenedentota bacterium]HOH43437.1 preprotein translocase subunit SecY [Candidatus Hydrogenedentota bacterium]HOM47139.1 preprotein translocase subunit SecY [Candidatus Hydrogenedentota bacterium]HOR51088.1 preprotein translocase subunit SecY [Candidatus Hydrogenedentota bacterium]
MAEPIEAFKNAFKIPELKSRILFTLLMLTLYRLGAHVPVPGVDGHALAQMLGRGSGLLGFYDLFTGGAFSQATVFALGIMPYITSSIILSLLVNVIPALENLQKQGQEGQRKINDYTRYGTIFLCIVQSIGIAVYLQSMGPTIVPHSGVFFIALTMITLTAGTSFIMWLGEQITEHGIGNGMSLIIFTGIVSGMPRAISNMFNLLRTDQISIAVVLVLAFMMVFVVAGAIIVTTGQRRIPVQYPKVVNQRRVSGGQRTYLPLRVNQAGVIPIIFASSILMLPDALVRSLHVPGWLETPLAIALNPQGVIYNAVYALLIIFFSFFYTASTFRPAEMADNMKKHGGVIIGVRPGKATADYLGRIMSLVTWSGSVFLAIVALVPVLIIQILQVRDMTIAHYFGGTTLLILVGVALDTAKQIEQHLAMRHYEGFGSAKGGRIRSRRM